MTITGVVQKLMVYLFWPSIMVFWATVILLTYWFVYPYKTITFNNLPHEVDRKVVKGGEYLTYIVDYCKYSTDVPIITKTFVDGIIYNTPDIIGTSKDIGCGTTHSFIYVPKALPPGMYTIKISYRYQVNPLRSITIESQTEKFEVR